MIKKMSVVSLSFFMLGGHFKSFQFVDSLPVDLLILLMILPLAYSVCSIIKEMKVNISFFVLFLFLFLLIPTIFYKNSDTEKLLTFLLIFFVLSFLSPILLDNINSIRLFVRSLFIASFSLAILSIIGTENTQIVGRLTLEGGNPIWLGRGVSLSALILLIMLFHNKISLMRFMIFIIPIIFVLISTGSRGPIIAIIIAYISIYLNNSSKFIISKKSLITGLLIFLSIPPLLLGSYYLAPNAFERILNFSSSGSIHIRFLLFNDAINIIKTKPFGIGVGNFNNYSFYDYPHNLFLEAFVEFGWIPAIYFVILIVLAFLGLKKFSKQTISGDVIFGVFIMAFVNSMVSGDITSPKELYLLLPIGLNFFLRTFMDKITREKYKEIDNVYYQMNN